MSPPHIKVQGETAGTKIEAAASYPEDSAGRLDKHSHTKQQTLNVDETTLNQR